MPKHYVIEVPDENDFMVMQDLYGMVSEQVELERFIQEINPGGLGPKALAQSINGYLQEQGMHPLLREDTHNMGLAELKQIMDLQKFFKWRKDDIEEDHLHGQNGWRDRAARNWRVVESREAVAA